MRKNLLLAALVGGMLLAFQPAPAHADLDKTYQEALQLFKDDNLAEAMPLLRRNIQENHQPSILLLAYIQDLAEENQDAVRLLRQGAELDNAQAAFYLGVMLTRGEDGVKIDLPEGRKWITKAVEQNYLPAVVYLGLAYRRGGLGLSVDEDKAYKLFLQAAEKGSSAAMQILYEAFRDGQMGLPKDKQEATYWNKEYQKTKKLEAEEAAKNDIQIPTAK